MFLVIKNIPSTFRSSLLTSPATLMKPKAIADSIANRGQLGSAPLNPVRDLRAN